MKQQQIQYFYKNVAIIACDINNASITYQYTVKTMVPHFWKPPILAQKPQCQNNCAKFMSEFRVFVKALLKKLMV